MDIGFWWENQKGRDHFEDVNVDWTIILKRIIEK
jgi:hypothetical protein